MNRTSTKMIMMALLIVCALAVSTVGAALAAQPMGITPTATDTTEPPTNTPTPTNTQPVDDTPTPTSTSDVDIPTSTATPTATSDLGISTATPTPTTDISITATATLTGTVIVNPPTDPPRRTSTQVPILPSTGEFPFEPILGLEWLFAFLLVVVLAALMFRAIGRSRPNQ